MGMILKLAQLLTQSEMILKPTPIKKDKIKAAMLLFYLTRIILIYSTKDLLS